MSSRGVHERTIDVGGVTLPLQVTGEGDTVVHLRSGGAAPATVAILSDRVRVFAVDVGRAAEAQSAQVLASMLADALAGIGIEKFSVVAQSACSGLALWLGLSKPDAIAGIVLTAPTVFDAAGSSADAALEARLPELKSQVLTLFGTSDKVSPPQLGRLYRQKIPGCHMVFVYDAGQNIETDRGVATAAVMQDFLERREQFVVSAQSSKIYP